MKLDRIVCGRRDSNSYGLPPAPLSESAGDQRPADPKSAAYAYSATPAPSSKVDAHGTIGHNKDAYSAVCSQGRRGGSPQKRTPLARLGLGPLTGHGLCHRGTSHLLPAFRLTASTAAAISGPGRYTRPPSARRLELSYTASRLNPSVFSTASTSRSLLPIPLGSQRSVCATAGERTPSFPCSLNSFRNPRVPRMGSKPLVCAVALATRPALPLRSGASSTRSSAANRRAASSSDWKVISRPAIFILKAAMGMR